MNIVESTKPQQTKVYFSQYVIDYNRALKKVKKYYGE